jgi:cytochrome c oxidase subunit 4
MSRAVARLVLAWVGLLVLLAITFGAAHLPLGTTVKPWVGYVIASAKAAIVLWYFMEMRREGSLARLAMIVGFVWLAILLMLTAADFLTRG